MKIKRVSNDAVHDIEQEYSRKLPSGKTPMGSIILNIISKGSIWEKSQNEPVIINRLDKDKLYGFSLGNGRSFEIYVLYQNYIYQVDTPYSDEEIRLVVLEESDKERRRFELLRAKFDKSMQIESSLKRTPIPEEVRISVWRRDQGRCVRCGSRENLEYDHIIPVSEGGSNTVRNIELLCEKCNRAKSNNIQ